MKFANVPGNRKSIAKLIRSVQEERIAHSQLFSGPEGSGGLLLALAYSSFLNCSNRIENTGDDDIPMDSCGECPSCRKIDKLEHPDLHFLFPIVKAEKKELSREFFNEWREYIKQRNGIVSLNSWYNHIKVENKQGIISVKDINDILGRLNYKNFEAKVKVIIIWLAEKIQYAAAPKILKTLEEPADNTLFILISENQNQILPTILSRVQITKTTRPNIQESFSYLSKRYNDLKEESLYDAIYYSEGNVSKALEYLTDTEEILRYGELFIRWMRNCFGMNASEIVNFGDDFSKLGREKQKYFFQFSADRLSKSYHMEGNIGNINFYNENDKTFFEKFSSYIPAEKFPDLLEKLNEAAFHIERNGNPKIIISDLSFDIGRILRKPA
ncbi:MAG: hypothetical protein C0592_08985 [Marinilabiliales bacterium]|nr:MAG: hypothetical protein C0592_08985 [Marinilabiliales bacterium]